MINCRKSKTGNRITISMSPFEFQLIRNGISDIHGTMYHIDPKIHSQEFAILELMAIDFHTFAKDNNLLEDNE